MSKRWLAAFAVVVLSFSWSPMAWSQPADVPGPGKLQIELKITPKGISLRFGASAANAESTPALDTFMPAYVEQMLHHFGDMVTQPSRATLGVLGRLIPLQRWLPEQAGDWAEESGAEEMQTLRDRTMPLGLVEVAY